MLTTDETVCLAECIIDDTCLVIFLVESQISQQLYTPSNHGKYKNSISQK